MHSAILKPVVVLIGWTLVMLVWTVIVRMPALKAAGIELSKLVGGKGTDADRVLPARTQWPSHNYNHLLEQPTIFYAICGVLALAEAGDGPNAALAWAYVALRIAHSLWQALVNRVSTRFALFFVSTIVLAVLTVRAAVAVF